MLNPATHYDRNRPNDFTNMIIINQRYGVKTLIRLRNNTMVFPFFKEAEDETCSDVFATEDWKYCWNMDGTSVTSRDYDMMEIVNEIRS